MGYSDKARALRLCTGTNKNGSPCKRYASWGDPEQMCSHHRSKHRPFVKPVCHCEAYEFGHRPGGGLCEWPDAPTEKWSEISERVKVQRREELRVLMQYAFLAASTDLIGEGDKE